MDFKSNGRLAPRLSISTVVPDQIRNLRRRPELNPYLLYHELIKSLLLFFTRPTILCSDRRRYLGRGATAKPQSPLAVPGGYKIQYFNGTRSNSCHIPFLYIIHNFIIEKWRPLTHEVIALLNIYEDLWLRSVRPNAGCPERSQLCRYESF